MQYTIQMNVEPTQPMYFRRRRVQKGRRMKYLLIVSDSIIDDITERYPNIEIKPIKQPMFVDTSGYSIYLTQEYVDALMKLSEKIVIEEAVKKATDNLLTVPKFDKPLCPAGLIFKAYNKQGKGEEE